MVKDLLCHVEIQIDNTGGLAYVVFFKWNHDGSHITFDTEYINNLLEMQTCLIY
jgi:hypothetical protein